MDLGPAVIGKSLTRRVTVRLSAFIAARMHNLREKNMSCPVHEICIGLIKARIRRKRSRFGARHTVSVVRLYRDGDIWKESTRFCRNDLPLMRLVLDRAHTWILQQSRQRES